MFQDEKHERNSQDNDELNFLFVAGGSDDDVCKRQSVFWKTLFEEENNFVGNFF